MTERALARIVAPHEVSDGAGVRIRRLIGTAALDHVDPFLIFDEFGSDSADDYIAGFPPHPHRGIETVTYMLAGAMAHRDNHGNEGRLGPGDVQWMTAGRGIIHSEMPMQDKGLMRGFQIWVNLPAAEKMTAPRYQEIAAADIPEIQPAPGVRVKLIAGKIGNLEGAVRGIAARPLYADLRLAAGASVTLPVEPGHAAIAFAHDGDALIGGQRLAAGHLAILEEGDHVVLAAPAGAPAGLLLLAARPWREPIYRHGPFVMNSREQILGAIADYQAGRF